MKKLFSLLAAVMLLAAALPAAAFAVDTSYQGKTVILYTGNLRGDVEVYAQIKAAREAYEEAGADVILADAGNYLQGSAAANTDRGLSVYNLMDAAGYDVAAMGLGEFSYTDATTGYLYHGNLTRYYTQAELQTGAGALTYNRNRGGSVTADRPAKEAARFQTVAGNVTALKEGIYAFEPSAVFTTDSGLKVGFYGLTDRSVAENVQTGFVSVAAQADVTVEADVVVCLSNMAGALIPEGTVLIEAPTSGERVVGAVVIDNESRAVTREKVELDKADEAVAALAGRARENAAKVAGASTVILNGSDTAGWNRETNLGDLVTDALAWYAKHYVDGLDESLPVVALQNGGNCDNFLYPGDITETDLLRALPFSPMGIGVLQVTGRQLLETLEAASQTADCPGFAQVSGLTYTVDATRDYDGGAAYGNFFVADSINRVTVTSVNGRPFDPDAVYALVCDNFLMNGSDTYYTLKSAKEAEGAKYLNNGSGVKVRDAVALYIERELDGTVGQAYAKPQGRIAVLSFSDVKPGSFYFEAADWAAERGITNGVTPTSFAPADPCTHAQILTFLYRAERGGTADPEDMDKAVSWARDKGLIDEGFDGGRPCTRAEAVHYIWQAQGRPEAKAAAGFTDVAADADYAKAVSWAVEKGVTNGSNAEGTTFSPDVICTRGHIVTFLHRGMN